MTNESETAILIAMDRLEEAGDLTDCESYLIDLIRSQVALQGATRVLIEHLRQAVESERQQRIWQAVSRSVN